MSVTRYDIAAQARFLTYSCFQRFSLLGQPHVRDLYVREIATQSARLGFEVIAYVVMPEHVHLIVVPPVEGRIAGVLRGLKQGLGRRMPAEMRENGDPMLARLVGPHGRALLWQRGDGYDRNVRGEGELREKIGYIHANPVRRGLVERAEDWVWSSARDYAGEPGVVDVRRGW